MSGIKLFVDDWREPPEGWELARTITEAVRILSMGYVDVLSLDHDIVFTATGSQFSDENFSTVARYVAVMPENLRPKRVYIHTANGDGAKTITSVLSEVVETVRISDRDYKKQILDAEVLRNG